MGRVLNYQLYFDILKEACILTLKNIHAFILFTLYTIIFYLGYIFYLQKDYLHATISFVIFALCISSVFYISRQIIKNGKFSFNDFIVSFRYYLFRANFILIFWFAIFFFINQYVLTPISSIIKGNVLLYLFIVPATLLIFFVFNALPEYIYLSDEGFSTLFINSIKFIESHWKAWIIPTIIIMFLLNLADHRLSILPTLGYMDTYGLFAKLQDIPFYIRSLIFTVAIFYRGLLFVRLEAK